MKDNNKFKYFNLNKYLNKIKNIKNFKYILNVILLITYLYKFKKNIQSKKSFF